MRNAPPTHASRARRALLGLGCAFAFAGSVPASAAAEAAGVEAPAARAALGSAAATGSGQGASSAGPSATLEQCVTAPVQADRSAAFSGDMTATGGTGRMSIRIELQQRRPGEAFFHTVAAPGLGVWRSAIPGIKVYRYIKQVTNLAAPATYRAAVRFRWLTPKGKLIKAIERRTAACVQPVVAPPPAATTPAPAA